MLRRCHAEEPELREILPGHGAACHQTQGYDGAAVLVPKLPDKREVVPEAVVEGDPQAIVKQELAT